MSGLFRWCRSVHYAWVVLGATFVAIGASAAVRASFGIFVQPLEVEFGWDRAVISGVAALALLGYGVAQPLIGQMLDRWGPRRVLAGSLLVLAGGVLGTALIRDLWQLYLFYGVIASLAAGGPSMATISAIAARWFEARRGLVVGIAISGVSAGQLVLIPVAMWLNLHFGWRVAYAVLAGVLCLVALPIVWLLVRDDPAAVGRTPFGAVARELPRAGPAAVSDGASGIGLLGAVRSAPFWLLAGSYFVCGYSTAGLVDTHVVPYALEHGVPHMAAASALGLMGAVNTLGAIAAGLVTDRYGRRNPLAATYVLRGLALLWLLGVHDARALHGFAVVFGLSYIATVPPTTALATEVFGRRSVASIYGWIFLAHQIGAATGSLIGGVTYAATGTYLPAFLSGALACFAAAGMVLAVRPAKQSVVAAPAAP
ncbi:MAG TPA: MFS transporter [Chloroflexota bacterium]|nr:MFS transporter [Chloroflexota bacterium]